MLEPLKLKILESIQYSVPHTDTVVRMSLPLHIFKPVLRAAIRTGPAVCRE